MLDLTRLVQRSEPGTPWWQQKKFWLTILAGVAALADFISGHLTK